MTGLDGLASALAGRYRIERELGAGGMATVYLAHDLKHDRPVAIKVLRPELTAILGPERFAREIRITSQLDHPNILPLLDSGEASLAAHHSLTTHDSRLLFYVMPYMQGDTLRALMRREIQLPVDDALKLFGEIADALDYAHRQGFVHRDLKPENILLQDGHARVADFGIARSMGAVSSEKLTETGLALGTPQYMSPEQAAGQGNIDARSDVYALGCLLYEMLAGNPPFQGPTSMAIMARHAVDPVPGLRTVRATVPPPVEAAIAKALAKVPADRFTTAAQFVEAFSKPVPVFPGAAPPWRVTTLVAGAALALALAAGGWLFARSRQPHIAPSASVIAVLPLGTNGDTALTRLSHDLVLALSANLDGVGGIRTADPQMVLSEAGDSRGGQWLPNALAFGKRLGAASVVVGSIVPQGASVQLELKLVSTSGDSAPLARVSVTGSPDSIGALVDTVTWGLLHQVWRRGEPPSPSYTNLTTRSVHSLRAFLDGEQLFVSGRYAEAIDAYAAAIQADSSFWLAGWRYNYTQAWILHGTTDTTLEQGYYAHRSAFGDRDRLLMEAEMTEPADGDAAHLARLRSVTERFPADWLAWLFYADHLFHTGPLVGHSNAETRAALQRVVDLNPRLVPMWDHLAQASAGHDSAQADRALQNMVRLGRFEEEKARLDFDFSQFYRLLIQAGVEARPAAQLDSLAAAIASARAPQPHLGGPVFLLSNGFPAAQVELNRRLLGRDPGGPYTVPTIAATAPAWAARGAWDSAIVWLDRAAAASPERATAVEAYRLAVVGAWLGALDTSFAAARRPAAAAEAEAVLLRDATAGADVRVNLVWSDALLAVMRRDIRAVGAARSLIHQGGTGGSRFLDRSLAPFESQYRGDLRQAADSFANLDAMSSGDPLDEPDPDARSVARLAGAWLLLQLGDSGRAASLLYWHEARVDGRRRLQLYAPVALLLLARIEEAQGRNDLARDHYEQFLRRYDMPMPAQQHLVDEARTSLRKLNSLNDAAAKT